MDRLYQQIVAALDGHLDPEVFEACANDLLRDAFPGLFPIRGGTDAGMDGAIADGEGEAFPLVCTTGEDVIGNLTESLDSYLQDGGRRRKVVLATSRELNRRRRRALEERAREKGFVLVSIVDREGIARRLRRSPDWCRELGITWAPSALSEVPKTRRPFLEVEPVGRAADLAWLRTTGGDRILYGEPGSGKTFVLYQLVKEDWGLFLVDTDRAAIAEALAQERPKVVIVDDAHGSLAAVEELRQLRAQENVAFEIVATTWDGERERVAEVMGALDSERIRRLELLTQEEILEVYRRAGVHLSEGAMAHLIDQAANKPGLAVTLASIVLRSGQAGLEEVFRGEILRRTVTSVFRDLVGEEAETILASFALGGDRGMAMDAVADFLGTPLSELRRKVIGLASAGVLAEAGDRALAVWPRTLRPSLLRSVFFSGPGANLPYRPLLERARSLASAVEALVVAARYAAPVPAAELRALVVQHGGSGAWRGLAGIDDSSARWVIENYPGSIEDIAREALPRVPDLAVPRLLDATVGAKGNVYSHPSHPMRILADWIQGTPDGEEGLHRRRLAVELAKRALVSGGERLPGLRLICLALSPKWEENEVDALWSAVTYRSGLLPASALARMVEIWEQAENALEEIDADSWPYLKDALWSWFFPVYAAHGDKVPAEISQAMNDFAATALRDLARRAGGNLGLAAGLRELAGRVGLTLDLSVDAEFARLYPSFKEEVELIQTGRAYDPGELLPLAEFWASLPPEEIANRFDRFEDAGAWVDSAGSRRVAVFARLLAGKVAKPKKWFARFVDQSLAADLVAPLLDEVVQRRVPGWRQTLARGLDDGRLFAAAVSCVLRLPDPPPNLLLRAIQRSGEVPRLVETLCLRGELPLGTVRALLESGTPRTALAAAVGEWEADPRGQVRAEVALCWREALIRGAAGEGTEGASGYRVAQILRVHGDLPCEWVLAQARSGEAMCRLGEDEPLGAALSVLSSDQRRRVLEALAPGAFAVKLIPRLVARDPVLFAALLRIEALQVHQLVALGGKPDVAWPEMAQLALDAGWSAEKVAEAAFLGPHPAVDGYGVDYWRSWEEAFEALQGDSRAGIREVARWGTEMALSHRRFAESRERKARLYGH